MPKHETLNNNADTINRRAKDLRKDDKWYKHPTKEQLSAIQLRKAERKLDRLVKDKDCLHIVKYTSAIKLDSDDSAKRFIQYHVNRLKKEPELLLALLSNKAHPYYWLTRKEVSKPDDSFDKGKVDFVFQNLDEYLERVNNGTNMKEALSKRKEKIEAGDLGNFPQITDRTGNPVKCRLNPKTNTLEREGAEKERERIRKQKNADRKLGDKAIEGIRDPSAAARNLKRSASGKIKETRENLRRRFSAPTPQDRRFEEAVLERSSTFGSTGPKTRR